MNSKKYLVLSLILSAALLLAACTNGGVGDGTILNTISGSISINGSSTDGTSVDVTLYDSSQAEIRSITTDTGSYSFSDIPDGSYTIGFTDNNVITDEATVPINLVDGKNEYLQDLEYDEDVVPEVTSITISGNNEIEVPSTSDPNYSTYTVVVKDQNGTPMDGESVTWSIKEDSVSGVSIDSSTGKLTVTNNATIGTSFTVVATSETNSSVSKGKPVVLKEEAHNITSIEVTGDSPVNIPGPGQSAVIYDESFSATVKDQNGTPMNGENVTWSIVETDVDGVAIDSSNGNLTVQHTVADGTTITVKATSVSNTNISGTIPVTLNEIEAKEFISELNAVGEQSIAIKQDALGEIKILENQIEENVIPHIESLDLKLSYIGAVLNLWYETRKDPGVYEYDPSTSPLMKKTGENPEDPDATTGTPWQWEITANDYIFTDVEDDVTVTLVNASQDVNYDSSTGEYTFVDDLDGAQITFNHVITNTDTGNECTVDLSITIDNSGDSPSFEITSGSSINDNTEIEYEGQIYEALGTASIDGVIDIDAANNQINISSLDYTSTVFDISGGNLTMNFSQFPQDAYDVVPEISDLNLSGVIETGDITLDVTDFNVSLTSVAGAQDKLPQSISFTGNYSDGPIILDGSVTIDSDYTNVTDMSAPESDTNYVKPSISFNGTYSNSDKDYTNVNISNASADRTGYNTYTSSIGYGSGLSIDADYDGSNLTVNALNSAESVVVNFTAAVSDGTISSLSGTVTEDGTEYGTIALPGIIEVSFNDGTTMSLGAKSTLELLFSEPVQ